PERYQSRLKELVELLDVQDHLQTQLRRLSLGERMKVELIGALLHSPELLFLDEPTIGLDVVSKKNIRQFLRQIHQDEGVTLVLTSHDMDDISEVCQRAVIINKGSLVYDGPLSKLTAEYQKERYIQVSFTDDPGMEELTPLAEEVELKEDGFLLKVEAAKMVPTVSALFSKFQVADIKIESVPLEDVIAEIFKGGH
ncbi:MAG: ATP-binding cassette domain-containing protein, partial [Methanothrix sp.]